MSRHRLEKIDLLRYALDGAKTYRGVNYEQLTPVEIVTLDKDIKEIERRITRLEEGDAR